MTGLALAILLSYLAGSIPTSIIVGKLLRGIDIREHGSGNAGGTNVFRVLGPGPGVFVMAFDAFKGFASAYWISRLGTEALGDPALPMLLSGCAAIVGHIWTVFAGFRGGKGVGAAAGMMLALYPTALLICLAVFLIAFALTRIVSVGSLLGALTLPLTLTLFRAFEIKAVPTSLYIFSFFAAALIFYTHRSNIRRLLAGTENRFGKKKRD